MRSFEIWESCYGNRFSNTRTVVYGVGRTPPVFFLLCIGNGSPVGRVVCDSGVHLLSNFLESACFYRHLCVEIAGRKNEGVFTPCPMDLHVPGYHDPIASPYRGLPYLQAMLVRLQTR